MPTDKPDTDPSTPSARSARNDGPIAPEKIVAVGPAVRPPPRTPPTPTTDPGPPPYMPRIHAADTDPQPIPPVATDLGPSAPPARSNPPLRAPVALPVPQRKNDSIELLLDGIAGDTHGKVAESRGEASLAYAGSEHTPPTPRKTPVPEPPVIVKGPRVVIALFAAIVVVLAVFLGMNAWSARVKRAAMAVDPSASELVTSPPQGAWIPAASATATPSATATTTPTTTPTTTTTTTTTPAATATATKKSSRPMGAPTSTDLGEFKQSIHH
jgi:hypothetical protein